MDAVKNDNNFDLVFDGKVYETVKAKELWNKIINNAYASAEPGLLFWDTMTDYHNAEYCSPLYQQTHVQNNLFLMVVI